MQLMPFFSEEGSTRGLKWINGKVKHFNKINNTNKIPHMGWNNLQIKQNSNPLLQGIDKNDFFYFVHSYFVKINNPLFILAESFYGDNFVSIFNKENIYGCQFHPEKSHDSGLKLLKNFSNL
jgi:glutamine amidotransferase